MHDYYRDCTNRLKNRRSVYPYPVLYCSYRDGPLVPVVAHAHRDCLCHLPRRLAAIFLLIMILFVLVWALTRFMMRGEN